MRKIDDIKDENYLHVNVKELKMKLVDIARKKGLSLNSLVRMVLKEYVDTEEKNEK